MRVCVYMCTTKTQKDTDKRVCFKEMEKERGDERLIARKREAFECSLEVTMEGGYSGSKHAPHYMFQL